MEIVDFNGSDYSLILSWFDLAFGKKSNYTQKDLDLLEKIKVMARQWLEDEKDAKKE